MTEIFTHLLQYVAIFIMFILTFNSLTLINKDEEEAVFGYRINILLTMLLHMTLFGPIVLQTKSLYYVLLYGAQMIYLLLFPLIFRFFYRKSRRLLINLMMIMLAIGLPVLTRLNRAKSIKQFEFLLAASVLVIFVPIALKRFEASKKLATFLGIVGMFMLGAVLVLAKTVYGASLSISIGPISVQPSEFVKLSYVLLLAKIFANHQDFKHVTIATLAAMAHTGILVLSKDLGGALIYYGIFLVVLYVATQKKSYVLLGTGILGIGGVLAYFMFAHVRVRVTAWLDPWSVIETQGYQVAQSLFSITDGSWFGKGMYLGYPSSVPVVEKDFIFSAISEELGAIFAILLILMCFCMFMCMVKIAMNNSVVFYKLISMGLATAYGIQSFLTIGGAMKLIPSTGVTLPFVSYGGSSLVSSMLMFGILQGLFIKGNQVMAAKKLREELDEEEQAIAAAADENNKTKRKAKAPSRKQKALLKKDDTGSAALIVQNHESRVVGYLFMLIYASCIGYLVYFLVMVAPTDTIMLNPYHLSRINSASEKVIRGSIISSDGTVLAVTEKNEDGAEVRRYPFDNLFAHSVGYTVGGTYGLENVANKMLLTATRTVTESLMDDINNTKKNGDNVITTLDAGMQYTVYNAIGAYNGAVVVMEADTGKVLAMVSKPDFDPNTMGDIWANISEMSGESFLVNRATQGQYPPGSTFKLITLLAYMREHPDDYMDYTYTCKGSYSFGGYTLGCSEGHEHGVVNAISALEQSCNGYYAGLGTMLNNDTLINIAEEMHFNEALPIMYQSKKSSLPIKAATTDVEKTQICIGQGAVLETPLYNAMITASIANNGVMVKPQFIERIESSTGNVVEEYKTEAIGRVMSTKEASLLEQMMLSVVKNGTGFNAKSEDYNSAGKTGSAQYSSDSTKYHAWYTGYAWQKDKKIVVSVVLEGAGSGGWNAAPVAKKIFDYYFGIEK